MKYFNKFTQSRKPKVSVIVATNRNTITCRKSLESQDYDNFEVLYISEGNTAAEGRNIGVRKSKGSIIVFLDDDTIIPKDWISKAVELINSKKTDIAGGPNLIMPDSSFGEKIGDFLLRFKLRARDRKKFELGKDGFSGYRTFSTCNIAMKKDAFEKVGGFSKEFLYTEDMEFLLLCELHGYKFYYSSDLFVYHKRKPFPFAHIKRLIQWGYGNTQIAFAYHKVFGRIDISGMLLSFFTGLFLFVLFPIPVFLVSLLFAPITLHLLSYAIGILSAIFDVRNWKKRSRYVK